MTIKKAAEILAHMNVPITGSVITSLDHYDHDLKDQVLALIYTFEDLQNLFDSELQLLLQNLNDTTLAIALKKTSTNLKDALLRNLPRKRRENILNDPLLKKPTKESEVLTIQKNILAIAWEMHDAHNIQMSKIKKTELSV